MIIWDTDDYLVQPFDPPMLRKENKEEIKIFLSTPYRSNDKNGRSKAQRLGQLLEKYYKQEGITAKCNHPYNLVIDEWNYVNGIIKHFPVSRFIIHDVTGFSPGVIFEVGCSIGLNKKFVLIWDTSIEKFNSDMVPNLLKRANIVQINSSSKSQDKEVLFSVFESLDSADTYHQCPGYPKRDPEQPCPFFDATLIDPDPGKVFLVINEKYRKLKSRIIEKIRSYDKISLSPKDYKDEVQLCRVCAGVVSCGYIIVDDSDGDRNGLLALGMARAQERRTLELRREGYEGSKMFDGISYPWQNDTMEEDLDEALSQLLK